MTWAHSHVVLQKEQKQQEKDAKRKGTASAGSPAAGAPAAAKGTIFGMSLEDCISRYGGPIPPVIKGPSLYLQEHCT